MYKLHKPAKNLSDRFSSLPLYAKTGLSAVFICALVAGSAAALSTNKPSTQPESNTTQTAAVKSATTKAEEKKQEEKPVSTPQAVPAPAPQQQKPTQTAAKSAAATAPTTKPKPTPAPAAKPTCLECGGDPDKVVTHVGSLILSSGAITITAGGSVDTSIVARSDSGEAITIPYTALQANFNKPMVSASPRPIGAATPTFNDTQTFSFVASPGAALGTYVYQIASSGANGGRYTGSITVTIVAP